MVLVVETVSKGLRGVTGMLSAAQFKADGGYRSPGARSLTLRSLLRLFRPKTLLPVRLGDAANPFLILGHVDADVDSTVAADLFGKPCGP